MKIPLTGGAYQARSVIASAQRCLNLFIEPQPPQDGEPTPAAHYPTPGLVLLRYLPELPVRALRQASNGKIYAVIGKGLYRITPPAGIADWDYVHLGDITPGLVTPASLADNTIDLVVVDGSPNGWSVHLDDDTSFASIDDPNFFGADRVDYIDTYFVFNRPGTQQMYWSGALALTFDELDRASKSAAADLLVSLVVANKEIILVGERTTEVFYDAAVIDPTTGFLLSQFASVQGVFIDYGCAAKYSLAGNDNTAFFLSRDRTGKGIVMMVAGYRGKRISTFAIENAIRKYSRIDDAIGFCYQIGGHIFYVLTFPTADHTWVYDLLTGEWHEWAFTDSNGNDHAHRIMCVYPCFGTLLAGDRQAANLYALDPDASSDAGFPIKRERCFPHLIQEARRIVYREFLADMETGTGPSVAARDNLVSLSWSDDRGRHFGNPVSTSLGGLGDTLTSLQWQRLGMARDRIFKLTWSTVAPCALQGAWITYDLADDPNPAPKKQGAAA
jgi:hypothetical protein